MTTKRPPVFKSAFVSIDDEFSGLGIRPVVFDILGPDLVTSILPEGLRLVLHVNPSSISMSYAKQIERIQTKGGWVEQHWGEAARSLSLNMATGGFKRLFSGLSNVTGGGQDTGGTRRETIAYDKYLDMLALFHNNGSIYDTSGQIAFQGIIKVSFDGGVYLGWFQSFNVTEAAEKPYQFDLTAEFTVAHEILRMRTNLSQPGTLGNFDDPDINVANSFGAIADAWNGVTNNPPPPQQASPQQQQRREQVQQARDQRDRQAPVQAPVPPPAALIDINDVDRVPFTGTNPNRGLTGFEDL